MSLILGSYAVKTEKHSIEGIARQLISDAVPDASEVSGPVFWGHV